MKKRNIKIRTIYDSEKDDMDNHMRTGGSVRGANRIRIRTVLGDKFDYGEKVKEKNNYVYYVSGQGYEKKEIEEIEQIQNCPKEKSKIIEEKEIIDNYQYHETKNLKKKKMNDATTYHERLCTPFEKTTLKKYSSYTNEPKVKTYKTVVKDITDRCYDLPKKATYSSYTTNLPKYGKKNIYPSKVFETYVQPYKKNSILMRNKTPSAILARMNEINHNKFTIDKNKRREQFNMTYSCIQNVNKAPYQKQHPVEEAYYGDPSRIPMPQSRGMHVNKTVKYNKKLQGIPLPKKGCNTYRSQNNVLISPSGYESKYIEQSYYSRRIIRNKSYSGMEQNCGISSGNIKGFKDFRQQGTKNLGGGGKKVTKKITKKTYISNNSIANALKFPGKGTRVGGSGPVINRKALADKLMYKKYEQKFVNIDKSNKENYSVENLSFQFQNGVGNAKNNFSGVSSSLHGRQVMSNC